MFLPPAFETVTSPSVFISCIAAASADSIASKLSSCSVALAVTMIVVCMNIICTNTINNNMDKILLLINRFFIHIHLSILPLRASHNAYSFKAQNLLCKTKILWSNYIKNRNSGQSKTNIRVKKSKFVMTFPTYVNHFSFSMKSWQL